MMKLLMIGAAAYGLYYLSKQSQAKAGASAATTAAAASTSAGGPAGFHGVVRGVDQSFAMMGQSYAGGGILGLRN